jgi:hypothetical protein
MDVKDLAHRRRSGWPDDAVIARGVCGVEGKKLPNPRPRQIPAGVREKEIRGRMDV